jgi:hypothetical protein
MLIMEKRRCSSAAGGNHADAARVTLPKGNSTMVKSSRFSGARKGRGSRHWLAAALGSAGLPLLAAPALAQPATSRGGETHVESRAGDSLDAGPDDGSLFEVPPPPPRRLGLMFDLGTMDGAMMSLVYRPLPVIRFYAGGGTNGASPGIRAGAAAMPFRDSGWSFSLDGGHFFPGNVNGLFAAFAGSDYDDSHLLEHFDYNYVNLQVGWDVERGDLLFFARGGVGLLWTRLPSENLGRINNLSSMVDPDGSVEALLPSLKVGIIGFL